MNRGRISIVRLLVVLGVTTAVLGGAAVWAASTISRTFATPADVVFAPYVDITLEPIGHFEDPQTNPAQRTILGFVVADPADGCRPTWGTYYDLDAAGRALDLDRRIVRYRERGGDPIVSFGGQANQELATTCDDVDALTDAYLSVVDRYRLTGLDFDIEGPALDDAPSIDRRAEAIARLQARRDVDVWFTLPVTTTGLTDAGVDVVDAALAAGVAVSGVNAMTMNYALGDDLDMQTAIRQSLEGVRRQLDGALQRAGSLLPPEEVWHLVGATPMIGQNDVPSDRFTPQDAQALVELAGEVGLGRLGMWSMHRDAPCGAATSSAAVSNTCSGVDQRIGEFTGIFLSGAPDGAAVTSVDAAATDRRPTRDEPATSPYPIWRATRAYEVGDKVVWRGGVYEAKWFSENELPDAPVDQPWDTPWRYLGPVLEIDASIVADHRPSVDGVWDEFDPDAVYVDGDEVELDGIVYRAAWWTQGVAPESDPDRPFDHPWQVVGQLPDSVAGDD